MGRSKGSRNVGYFFRTGRGWGRKVNGRFVPLLDCEGKPLKDPDTPVRVLNEAFERSDAPRISIRDLANLYLKRAKVSPATYKMRLAALTQFCKAHGKLYPEGLKPIHLEGLSRIQAQAVRRMLNWAKEQGVHTSVKVRVPAGGSRVTCITPEQEVALLAVSNSALKNAIRVLIRTGMRPNEFIKLTNSHVTDLGKRMEFRFRSDEVKTRRARIVRLADPEIIEIVRSVVLPFKNRIGTVWKRSALAGAFKRAKRRATTKLKVTFDDDCCLYSCRHTFAKRTLTGYWSGKPCSIEILATLMGNSPSICRKYYLEWAEEYSEPLWSAI